MSEEVRPSWHEYFIGMAFAAADRGTCPRAKVGAVLVYDSQYPITTGFNGAKSKEKHCTEVGCKIVGGACRRTIHAECNAINIARDILNFDVVGTSLYCTHAPCLACATYLSNCGIQAVYYCLPYRITDGLDYLSEVGIKTEEVDYRR